MPRAPRLLEVQTPEVVVTVYGPEIASHGTLGYNAAQPYLAIESSSEAAVDAHYRMPTREWIKWQPGQPGPTFFEATTYRIVVESRAGRRPPRVQHRDPTMLENLDIVRGHAIVAGTLNFHQQLGRSTFAIDSGAERTEITIEVFPTKLDYATDYERILDDVAASARALALEYLRATYRSGATIPERGDTNLEWLTLVRNEVTRIERALRYLEKHPHRALERTIQLEPVERIGRPSRPTIRAIARGRGAGNFVDIGAGVQARAKLPARRAVETLDTPEHRWLRQQLVDVQQRLGKIFSDVQAQLPRRRHEGSRPRHAAELREITQLQERLALGDVSSAV